MKLPPLPSIPGVITSDDLLAYGLACAEAMREECAKVCDEIKNIARPQCEANYTDGDAWAATCADAIRQIEVER